MDDDAINRLGVAAIRPELSIVNGIADRKSLVEAFARFERLGIPWPLRFEVSQDQRNSTVNMVYLNQGGLTLPNRDYYLDAENRKFDRARQALPVYARHLLIAAGKGSASASAAAAVIVDMETAIARAHWDKVRTRDTAAGYNPYAVVDLVQLGPNIDWRALFTVLGVGKVERVIVGQPDYATELDGLVGSRSIDDWKNHLTFRVMDTRASNLDSTTAAIRFEFRNRTLSGQERDRERWKRGIDLVNGILGEAVGKLYVAEYFPPEARTRMNAMVQNVMARWTQAWPTLHG